MDDGGFEKSAGICRLFGVRLDEARKKVLAELV